MKNKSKIAAAMRGLSLVDLMAVLNAANDELFTRGFPIRDFENREREIVQFTFIGGKACAYILPKIELPGEAKAYEKESRKNEDHQ